MTRINHLHNTPAEQGGTNFRFCGGEQSLRCNQQSFYSHGAQMCTTACMQVGMGILCGQIDLYKAWEVACASSCSHYSLGCSSAVHPSPDLRHIVNTLNWCMKAGSVVHGRLERILGGGRGGHWGGGGGSRMISVNELVSTLGIDMQALGVRMDEFVICRQGLRTKLVRRDMPCRLQQGDDRLGFMYEADSCYISLGHLPLCMKLEGLGCGITSDGSSVALVTANHHTVCAACYCLPVPVCHSSNSNPSTASLRHAFALFDPLPGMLWFGLSEAQLSNKIQSVLGMPSSVRGGCLEQEGLIVSKASMEKGIGKMKKGMRYRNSSPYDGDSKGSNDSGTSDMHDDISSMCFYGDVTLMHVLG